MENNASERRYGDRDKESLGQTYLDHVSAMTRESLHSKSDIAAELAHRDIEIDRLQSDLATLTGRLAEAESNLKALRVMNEHWVKESADAMQQRDAALSRAEKAKAAICSGCLWSALRGALHHVRDEMKSAVNATQHEVESAYFDRIARILADKVTDDIARRTLEEAK